MAILEDCRFEEISIDNYSFFTIISSINFCKFIVRYFLLEIKHLMVIMNWKQRIFSNMFFRNMLADFGERSSNSKDWGGFYLLISNIR